jgi:hypothetical protein
MDNLSYAQPVTRSINLQDIGPENKLQLNSLTQTQLDISTLCASQSAEQQAGPKVTLWIIQAITQPTTRLKSARY